MIEIGMSLPTMAKGYSRATTVDWCRSIDAGPWSSISCGERITYHNQEVLVTNAAAAALTERVRVFVNLVVGPLHAAGVLAKQLATLDVLADGRLTVGLGVGGREADYEAAGSPFARRHARLDEQVADLRRYWAGKPPDEGADPIGPAPVQPGGPTLLAGAMGPKALARAAVWADGNSGFSLAADADEMQRSNRATVQAWTDAGRTDRPRLVSGCFFALGVPDAQDVLAAFTHDYLAVFGERFARALAGTVAVSTPERVRQAVAKAEAAGCDEFILVPATTDISCLDAATEVVTTLP
jgi:alkanesulfonate monooxygenase SsuD/methylene tetrahydromethanopterin reductase-like flavin-dependent oxidoreductase (luciferase family)